MHFIYSHINNTNSLEDLYDITLILQLKIGIRTKSQIFLSQDRTPIARMIVQHIITVQPKHTNKFLLIFKKKEVWYHEQRICPVAGLERMTTGSVVRALPYHNTKVRVFFLRIIDLCTIIS